MIDSGSWFAIWAICLRTSFFVMMPRSLLEKKQNREKRSELQYGLMPVRNPDANSTWAHRKTTFTSFPRGWWGQPRELWPMACGYRYESPLPGHLHFPHILSPSASQRQRSPERTRRSQKTDLGATRLKGPGSLTDCVVRSPHLLQPTLM